MTTKVSQCLISFFFLYAHSWTVYQCTLNVLFYFFIWWSALWMCWHCFLSIHFNSHPTLCLSKLEEAYAVEAWYMPECLYWHWEYNAQNVFMGLYSMVYLLCVFVFPRSWWGWIAVFIKSLNMKFQSCWLILPSFLFLVLVCSFPRSVFGYVVTVLPHVAIQAFSWDSQPRGELLEKTWVKKQLMTFSHWFF